MRRLIICLLSVLPTAFVVDLSLAQQALEPLPKTVTTTKTPPKLRQLSVPAAHARSIATKLSVRYREVPNVTISPDARNEQLVVMAPEHAHNLIEKDVQTLLGGQIRTTSAVANAPLQVNLQNITWQQFEGMLHAVAGDALPVTTSRSGMKATFQLTGAPLNGTTVEVDRGTSKVTVVAPQPTLPGWKKLIAALDKMPARNGDITELMRVENADPAPIQRMLRLLGELEKDPNAVAMPINANSPFRNAVFQAPNQNAPGAAQDTGEQPAGDADDESGTGVIGDTQIQFVPELGQIIIRGAKRDVARVMDVIKEIELKSKLTQPEIQVAPLKHTDANAVAGLLNQLYDDVLSARQGDVSITSLDHPNALLLIGRKEAVDSLLELISKIDLPIDESSRLRVFRLQNASAVDAEQSIRDFFTDRPGSSDDVRPGLGTRVRVLADYRTNSLIVSASPRDMDEVTQLVNDLDVKEIPATQQLKIFPLINASAEDLATTLTDAITGEGEGGSDNVTVPATSLSIVAIDGQQAIDSGVLAGVTVTADVGANSLVVRAPAGSMPLIAELIRQLDKAPNIDSFVKVFTIKWGDATQLTTALSTLFGDEAATQGTQVGAANLPSATASAESTLIPLRFSTDIRTNSIIVSGSSEDLEVVESILLRLDSEGFAERINEVIWLRHNDAALVAQAITDYVSARRQSQTSIQQYQQGLGPYDLIDRDLIAIPEINSNSILLSVSPRLYEEVRRLVDRLDRRRPLILIKVMLAEVDLEDSFEIGGEVGLQDSLMFNRGIAVPDVAIPGTGAGAVPGFNFNDASVPNVNRFGQENLAATGVTTFGLGTVSERLNYGGFVLNAASESVSLLLRTLQEAQRAQILTRPQVATMDNTESIIRIGRKIARVTGVINNGLNTQVVTEDIDVGIILQVRPRVGRDGLITMDIDITRSERDDDDGTFVPTGNANGDVVFINDIIDTTAQSTLTAYSGQTVIFGGLIQKARANVSRRVPWVGDLPILGYFFKFDQESELRKELLIFMTPMLITGDEDLEYVKQAESSRMSWCLADVVEAHGDVGMSGGYGLWGPAVGPTIYPHVNPTVQREVVISDEVIGGAPAYSSGESGPIISEPVTSPILPPPAGVTPPTGQPLPPPPVTPPEVLPNTLPGGAIPGGASAAPGLDVTLPQSPSDANIPTVENNQLLTQVSQANQPFKSITDQSTAAEQAVPVAWFQQASSKSPQTGTRRPMPKRLGDASEPTPNADITPNPDPASKSGLRFPSISPRSWIK